MFYSHDSFVSKCDDVCLFTVAAGVHNVGPECILQTAAYQLALRGSWCHSTRVRIRSMHDSNKGLLILVFNKSNWKNPLNLIIFCREPSRWTTSAFNMLEYSIRGYPISGGMRETSIFCISVEKSSWFRVHTGKYIIIFALKTRFVPNNFSWLWEWFVQSVGVASLSAYL